MSDPKIAIAQTLIHEGGFSDNPSDSGGKTKYGITQKDMPNVNIADITPEQATAYYTEHYWKALYSEIESQDIANKLFDMGVLFGIGTAVKLLQKVVGVLLADIDGIFGPHTLALVNEADPYSLLRAYKTTLVSHAIGIANANTNDRVFLAGWIKRINA
jgi:lysozyme family protein